MKKILVTIVTLMLLCSCSITNNNKVYEEKYLNLIDTVSEHTEFASFSNHFDITTDINQTGDGHYRYFVTVDNPRVAMYGIEIVAVEKGINYANNMAANVGVLDDTSYNLIPGQARPEAGYYKGVTVSGISASENPTIDVLVQWHGKDQNIIQEFFEFVIGQTEEVDG